MFELDAKTSPLSWPIAQLKLPDGAQSWDFSSNWRVARDFTLLPFYTKKIKLSFWAAKDFTLLHKKIKLSFWVISAKGITVLHFYKINSNFHFG